MFSRALYIFALVCIVLSGFLSSVSGAAQNSPADKVKAGFMLQFSKYVLWPDEPFPVDKDTIVLCLLGQDPFGSMIDQANKAFHERTIEIRRIKGLKEIQDCHMLYVSSERQQTMVEIVDAVKEQPILIVGNENDFLTMGGMINFLQVGTKIRFDIQLTNTEQNQLQFSSKLLKVANDVKQTK